MHGIMHGILHEIIHKKMGGGQIGGNFGSGFPIIFSDRFWSAIFTILLIVIFAVAIIAVIVGCIHIVSPTGIHGSKTGTVVDSNCAVYSKPTCDLKINNTDTGPITITIKDKKTFTLGQNVTIYINPFTRSYGLEPSSRLWGLLSIAIGIITLLLYLIVYKNEIPNTNTTLTPTTNAQGY